MQKALSGSTVAGGGSVRKEKNLGVESSRIPAPHYWNMTTHMFNPAKRQCPLLLARDRMHPSDAIVVTGTRDENSRCSLSPDPLPTPSLLPGS
jgi:hypothetical protein